MATPLYFVRHSPIHGMGVFAQRPIRKGVRVIEYVGELITPEEADVRYDDDRNPSGRVLLFTVDRHTLIDAGRGGNAARFINHSCAPNCESIIEDGHVYIETIRQIARGEELTYDYHLEREGLQASEATRLYPCNCGSDTCRGTLMDRAGRSRAQASCKGNPSKARARKGRNCPRPRGRS